MASSSSSSSLWIFPKPLALSLLLLSVNFISATSIDFLVGGEDGWAVPHPKEGEKYNDWASKNRFRVNDTIHFKYNKDSVMEVTEEEYGECRSVKPLFFANNGDTVLPIDRPGLFYFISGVSGHCERGQKMIIKVLEPTNPPQPTNSTPAPLTQTNAAAILVPVSSSLFAVILTLFVSRIFF